MIRDENRKRSHPIGLSNQANVFKAFVEGNEDRNEPKSSRKIEETSNTKSFRFVYLGPKYFAEYRYEGNKAAGPNKTEKPKWI